MRLNYVATDKTGFSKMMDLLEHIKKTVPDEQLLHLIYLRVSQINGCSYCIDMHYKDALKAGVDPRHINAMAAWVHVPFFSEKWKAAFAWAEAVTKLDQRDVPEEKYKAMLRYYSPEETVALTFAIAQMNALNRIAIAFGNHPAA
jgi:AhpD family alkylhydroperoxidase